MGIIIAAAITTLLAILAFGYLVYRLCTPADWRVALAAAAVALPLQPLVFYAVRLPLHALLQSALGPGIALNMISLFYAPLTEEPAKWLVLLVPWIRRVLRPDNAVAFALATGLGFGIGEIWFLAEQLTRVPQFAAAPFYMFGGFLSERLLVVFVHGATVAFAFKWLADGRSFALGALLGVVLHFLINFPIFLMSIDPIGVGRDAWSAAIQIYLIAFVIALGAAVNRMTRGRLSESVLGSATCPECGSRYPRSLLGLNFVTVRYERCPNCRHWHWVPMKQPAREG